MPRLIGLKKPKTIEITHTECGGIIEYQPNEVQSKVENEPFGGGTDVKYYIICPNCHKEIRLRK